MQLQPLIKETSLFNKWRQSQKTPNGHDAEIEGEQLLAEEAERAPATGKVLLWLREGKHPEASGRVWSREQKKQTEHDQGYLKEKEN